MGGATLTAMPPLTWWAVHTTMLNVNPGYTLVFRTLPLSLCPFCLQHLKMCPKRPPGVADCYTIRGMCARDSTCAPMMLAVIECVTDMGYNNSTECGEARMELRRYLQHISRGMSPNCTCITSQKQCRKYNAAVGLPEEEVSTYIVIL